MTSPDRGARQRLPSWAWTASNADSPAPGRQVRHCRIGMLEAGACPSPQFCIAWPFLDCAPVRCPCAASPEVGVLLPGPPPSVVGPKTGGTRTRSRDPIDRLRREKPAFASCVWLACVFVW